jgi:hypothetical protein
VSEKISSQMDEPNIQYNAISMGNGIKPSMCPERALSTNNVLLASPYPESKSFSRQCLLTGFPSRSKPLCVPITRYSALSWLSDPELKRKLNFVPSLAATVPAIPD